VTRTTPVPAALSLGLILAELSVKRSRFHAWRRESLPGREPAHGVRLEVGEGSPEIQIPEIRDRSFGLMGELWLFGAPRTEWPVLLPLAFELGAVREAKTSAHKIPAAKQPGAMGLRVVQVPEDQALRMGGRNAAGHQSFCGVHCHTVVKPLASTGRRLSGLAKIVGASQPALVESVLNAIGAAQEPHNLVWFSIRTRNELMYPIALRGGDPNFGIVHRDAERGSDVDLVNTQAFSHVDGCIYLVDVVLESEKLPAKDGPVQAEASFHFHHPAQVVDH
jgi:hypothetical protein